jgi:hypothetical protein
VSDRTPAPLGPSRAIDRASEQIAAHLRRLSRGSRRAAGFVIGFFDADPDPGDPVNLWGLGQGGDYRLHVRFPDGVVRQIATVASTGATATVPLTVAAEPVITETAYPATWATSYCPAHGAETGPVLGYGPDAAGLHGNRRVMVGFDDAQMRTDLAGSVVHQVELLMTNTDAHADIVTVVFGAHDATAAPASFSAVRADVWTEQWPRVGDGGWRDLPIAVGEWLRDNVAKGLTIDSPDSLSYAGQMDWASVRLRITSSV